MTDGGDGPAGGRPPYTASGGHAALVAAIIVAVIAVICFLPALSGGFVYDDHRFYSENGSLSLPSIWWRAFADPACQTADLTHAGLWRPLRTISFALDVRLGGAGSSLVPHLTNLLLHGIGTFLVARLLSAWRTPPLAAFLGALAYGLHPAQAECVAWISSRGDLLAAAFVWAALLADLRERRGTALVLGAAALLSKEQAIVWPAFVVLSSLLARRTFVASLRAAIFPAVATAGFLVLRASVLENGLQEGGLGLPVGAGAVVAMTGHQTWSAFLPVGGLFDWQMPRDAAGAFPGSGLAAAAVACAVLVVGLFLPRSRVPVLWFLVALVPTLFIQILVPLNILVADRFLLFALPAVALAAASGARRSAGGAVAATVVCACFAAIMWTSLPVWRSDGTLWTRTAERAAPHWRAESWLGAAALRDGRVDDAIRHLRVAASTPAADGRTFFQLALAEEQAGIARNDADLVAAAAADAGRARTLFATGVRQEGASDVALLAAVMEADLYVMLQAGDRWPAAVDALLAAPRGDVGAFGFAAFRDRASRLAARLDLAGDVRRAAGVRRWAGIE